MKICIITPDIAGPIRNGGIGTACAAIARLLAQRGHEVSVLYTLGSYTETDGIEFWRRVYAEEGIDLIPCPEVEERVEPHSEAASAWRVLRWLEVRHFDLLYAVEWSGVAGLVALARHEGLGFRSTVLVAGSHSPTLWHLEGQRSLPHARALLVRDHLERMTVAYADAVFSPSEHLLEWMKAQGWQLPGDARVIPNPVPAKLRKWRGNGDQSSAPDRRAISELVFFGRLEPRKGLILFVRALGNVPSEALAGVCVTFLGKVPQGPREFDALGYLERAMPKGVEWTLLTDRDAEQAVTYLAGEPSRLAVMPSLMENSPMTVVECLARQIPFLASKVGGIPDLLQAGDHGTHLFEPTPPELARALARVVADGLAPARPKWEPGEIDAMWVDALAAIRPERSAPSPAIRSRGPKVSVVLVHHNRPETLAQALWGLRVQTFKDFEVVLVDDGSSRKEAIDFLRAVETTDPEFVSGRWRIVRRENGYLGAARNTGWRAARGQYVLFHDDDNVSKERMLEVLVGVAEYAHADIVTSAMEVFSGYAPPLTATGDPARHIWAPLGASLSLGALENCFGDAQALMRRDLLEALGGFSDDYGVGHEDWELFARACLAGYTLLPVPMPLFWYRKSADSMLRTRLMPDADYLRSARPYLEILPPPLRPMLLLALAAEVRATVGCACSPEPSLENPAMAGSGKQSHSPLALAVRESAEAVTASGSIRATRPLRNLRRRLLGQPMEPHDLGSATSSREDLERLVRAYSSLSWDLTAPARLVSRLWKGRR